MTNRIKFIAGFRSGLKSYGHTISILINTVLLLVTYLVGVGITSIVARLVGKKFLDNKKKPRQQTFWIKTTMGTGSKKDYYRQF